MEEKELLKNITYKDFIKILPWNKYGLKWKKRKLSNINKIVIHQSLSDGKIGSINNYLISAGNHISPSKGCPHICYHIAIDLNGDILLCNNFDDITWHVKQYNSTAIGICVLGNFNGTGWNKGHEPSQKQIDSINNLLKQLIINFNFKCNQIYGHYHFGKPACPGKTLSNIVENFRKGIVIDFNRLDSIKDIQKALLKLYPNCLPKYGSDGIYGNETKLAIVKFQKDNKLNITGYPDEQTRYNLFLKLSV